MKEPQNSKPSKKALSDLAIRKMKSGDSIKSDIGENSGLRVKCGTGGTKTFFYRYKSPETENLVQVKIGNYPDWSLNEARIELQKLKSLRKSGVCPKAEAKRQKEIKKQILEEEQRQQDIEEFTVKDLVELYLAEYIEDRWVADNKNPDKKVKKAGARKLKGQRETRRTLYGDAVRALGDFPAAKVTRKMVVELINEIRLKRGANVQAGNVLREMSSAYEFAIGLGYFEDDFANPALLAKASLRQAKVKLTSTPGKRALSDKELTKLMHWLPDSGFSVNETNVLLLTLWTACRTGEAFNAKWEDVDLNKRTWHIKEAKNEAARDVQLSVQAVSFLKDLPSRNSYDYLFPNMETGLPMLQKSLTQAKWHMKNPKEVQNRRRFKDHQLWLTSIDDWVPHDLRRTVRTGLARLGCPTEIAEAVLGHSKKGIVGTYDLHSYDTECKEWLQVWADHMDGLLGM
jgi:integrase